jgi:pimeloyl-[acyl-carrier protein] methyl ester esterase
MSIHLVCQGRGAALLLVHGWGFSGRAFADLVPPLVATGHCVYTADLPGHGRAQPLFAELTLAELASDLLATLPGPVAWLGWSLGGLLAIQAAALAPEQVTRVVLVASTPRFTVAPGWSHAQPEELLNSFAQDLDVDPARALSRFISLNAPARCADSELIRRLRALAAADSAAAPAALRLGLRWLRETDLRAQFGQLHVPCLLVHGDQDRVVPPGAATDMLALNPRCRLHGMPGAGHAPFLSHLAPFLAAVGRFLHEPA